MRDTLAPYPWSHSVKSGVWLRALGNRDQRRPMGHKAWEGLYVFLCFIDVYHVAYCICCMCGYVLSVDSVQVVGRRHLHLHVLMSQPKFLQLSQLIHPPQLRQLVLRSQSNRDCLVRWQARQLVLQSALQWCVYFQHHLVNTFVANLDFVGPIFAAEVGINI